MVPRDKVKVSVVTVCYNAVTVIEKTIRSVFELDYLNFEYIVVDGASDDCTYDIVKSYQTAFDEKGVRFIHLSEKDDGIYPAMNKAILLCKADWVIFMNAGDCFFSKTVLTQVFSTKLPEDVSVIYGKVIKFLGHNEEVEEPNPLNTIIRSMPFCHQAAFVFLDDIKENSFDIQFKIAADYDMFLGLYLQGKKFLSIDLFIAYFALDGLSSKNIIKLYDDFLSVKHKRKITNKYSFFSRLKRSYFIIMLCIKNNLRCYKV